MEDTWSRVLLYLLTGAAYAGLWVLLDFVFEGSEELGVDQDAKVRAWGRFVLRTLFWPVDLFLRALALFSF